ncbi:hypothetical protein MAR_011256, partial [Mya arenaria]
MAHFDSKRIAALHAITQIASILRDVLTEQDRVYEEIFFRRKSSARSQDNVYSNLDKLTRTSKSNSNLGAITENIEHDEDSTYDSPSRPYALCTKKLNNRVDTQQDGRSTPQGSPTILFSRND